MSALIAQLRQSFVISRIRVHSKVKELRRGYVTIYAIDCSDSELSEVNEVEEADILNLYDALQHHVHSRIPAPQVCALCFGREAHLDAAPSGFVRLLTAGFAHGLWLRHLRSVVMQFNEQACIRRVLIHELTHALLDLLTHGFPYPIAIEEGFARAMEYSHPNDQGMRVWSERLRDHDPIGRTYIADSECISIEHLISLNSRELWKKRDAAGMARTSTLGFWLHLYLTILSAKHPRIRGILYELRVKNIRTPAGVYKWLLHASAMTKERLEHGFYKYCREGVIPDL